MNILNAFGYGGQVMLIGLCVVFFALALLICVILLMSLLFRKITGARERKAKEAAERAAAEAARTAAPVAAPAVEPAAEEVVEDAQLIAVIAAAIAAFDNSGKSLVVRKVRRVSGWNGSARQEQIYRF